MYRLESSSPIHQLPLERQENSQKHEYLCIDRKVRDYTKKQLEDLSEILLAKIKSLMDGKSDEPGESKHDQELQRMQAIDESLSCWPVTPRNNYILSCTISYSPRIEIESTCWQPVFPQNSLSLFPEPIGYKFEIPKNVTMEPFGVICMQGSLVLIQSTIDPLPSPNANVEDENTQLENTLVDNKTIFLDRKPDSVVSCKAKVSLFGERFCEKKIHLNMREKKIFFEIELFKLSGKVDAAGQGYLENGLKFDWEDVHQISNLTFIRSRFTHKPHIIFESS